MAAYLFPKEEEMNIDTVTYMIQNVKSIFKEQFKPTLVCNTCKSNECNQIIYKNVKPGLNPMCQFPKYQIMKNVLMTQENKTIWQL